ncbi:3-isopropylmalate dehydratase small subunit [Moorella naiadis]|uniref:3-isopropylmalate dehydratase small subunit n=1 Tax=Moorella naiadis (nom. illeg.) TaxID=3093670 RepID=UPI003D9C8180
MAKAWVLPNAVDTDVILPGRYLNITDPAELASHALEGLDPELAKKIKKGDFILAGRNFGCGSSREQAPVALKALGVQCVIAESFARIFYRNALNIGLLVLETKDNINELVSSGDEVELSGDRKELRNLTKDTKLRLTPLPEFMARIVDAGGIVPYLKKES